MSFELPGYDAWLERPYTSQPEMGECPECGEEAVESDKTHAECFACGWYDEPDYDSMPGGADYEPDGDVW